ncbi:LacI family DNA-binding transcriptional regulator [Actinoplanes sp. NPDC049548]|uniref:LacI family DNA-binding transcriptional regulator n=1 Tax=Actinoplanes sp. NPDC049548 TaxID=3155152 RepID=UPI00342F45DF
MTVRPPVPGMPTLADVARVAGVSRATASRALNDAGPVSAWARAQVSAAAAELGYVPHPLAVSLAKGQGHRLVIGVIAPSDLLFGEYMTRLISATAHTADPYAVGVSVRRVPKGGMSTLAELAVDRTVRGVVLVDHTRDVVEALPRELRGRTCVIGPGFDLVPSFDVDTGQAMKATLGHLLASGRRRIAMITGPRWLPSMRQPVAAYEEIMRGRGLPVRTVTGDRTEAGGRAGARTAVRRWPDTDAVVACTDVTALGVVQALGELGRRVPDDIAVTGFDDVSVSAWTRPSLTTATHPVEEIAAGAAQALLDGRTDRGSRVLYPSTLVRRQSA